MGKSANRIFEVNPWKITEHSFSPCNNMVAESVFSLGNEYMGARGCFDEGVSCNTLEGNYFNGIYEYAKDKNATAYRGVATQTHYMVNSVNFFGVEIFANGQRLDMALSNTSDYERELNLRNGKLSRKLVWTLNGGEDVELAFERFLDMEKCSLAYQRITAKSSKPVELTIIAKLNFNVKHWGNPTGWRVLSTFAGKDVSSICCATETTNQSVASAMTVNVSTNAVVTDVTGDKFVGKKIVATLGTKTFAFTRFVANVVNKHGTDKSLASKAETLARNALKDGYENATTRNDSYWSNFWDKSDIAIEGDDENQQGIRFCIFQLQQTYHGAEPSDNIGAKGLTGEAYSGHAFWDTETYCLPYYLFNNPQAARYLLEYRYNTLSQARKRATELDCKGACYPIATLNGDEACTLWQHASLQMQPSTGVAYGIFHYVNICKDFDFLFGHGIEMLVEICRYLVTRGQWNADNSGFGYYCVMGPDEFQMMVNHNTYTNYMAQKTLYYTLDTLLKMPKAAYDELVAKTGLTKEESNYFQLCADKMIVLYNNTTKLYEQHDGFFKLPHIDVDSIADSDFPLYSHWSYDRIYRNDMIKQPDVLMFMLLYPDDFTDECVKANYEYYEPRCIHESSLSPSVHSIIANRIGKYDEALNFFAFATRMDIDDYNRNTCEGLHTTSIAAAWLNVVYGFGGLRSDGKLSVAPTLPKGWTKYSFNLTYCGATLNFSVDSKGVTIVNKSNAAVEIAVYSQTYTLIDTLRVDK